jgi:hypothetical protein
MCYSAEASFIAGGVLTVTSISIARIPKEKASLPLSIIPAVFAAHQFVEGVIWLDQGKIAMGEAETVAVFLYALIAYVFWPVFIPYTSLRMEPEMRRRILIMICQAVGLVVGLSYFLGMLKSPVGVSIYTCNLSYQVSPLLDTGPAYILAVIVPFLVSSHRGLVLFGLVVLLSCAAGLYLASLPAFPSVWCFFAAFLSASLYAYFRAEQHSEVRETSINAYSSR